VERAGTAGGVERAESHGGRVGIAGGDEKRPGDGQQN
jgi:hypothetical protein